GLGLRSLDDAIGRTDLLSQRITGEARADRLDLSNLLVDDGSEPRRFHKTVALQRPSSALGDRVCLDALWPVLAGDRIEHSYTIENADRAVGARLGGALA